MRSEGIVVLQLFRDASAKVENPVFGEGERARNGLRHGLRLQAIAKSWSDTNGTTEEWCPGEAPTLCFSMFLSVSPQLYPPKNIGKAVLRCLVAFGAIP